MTLLPIDVLAPELKRAVLRAEKLDGFRYGMLIHKDLGLCFAHVTFYPDRKWWLTYLDTGDCVPLTRELDAKLERLLL